MQKTFALKVIPYTEYSRYVGYSQYQYNGYGMTNHYSSATTANYTDCATSCRNDRYCMSAFWRISEDKLCKKFNNANDIDSSWQNYNDNLRYYKY